MKSKPYDTIARRREQARQMDSESHAGLSPEQRPFGTPTGRMRFEDAAGHAKSEKKLTKARGKAEQSRARLDAAMKKLPQKRRLAVGNAFDADTGKSKRSLRFEGDVKDKCAYLKGPAATRPVKAVANAAIACGHRKIYQAERENVGVTAAHRGEMLAEGGLRLAYRFHRTAPYRKVERLTHRMAKHSVRADCLQASSDNPKLKSNPLSRLAHKRTIRKQYAKAAREAKKTAQKSKKTGDMTGRAARAVIQAAARHPVLCLAVAALGLLFILISALFASCGSLGFGIGSAVAGHLAEDADLHDGVEIALPRGAEIRAANAGGRPVTPQQTTTGGTQ
jgi:hypothetical protein